MIYRSLRQRSFIIYFPRRNNVRSIHKNIKWNTLDLRFQGSQKHVFGNLLGLVFTPSHFSTQFLQAVSSGRKKVSLCDSISANLSRQLHTKYEENTKGSQKTTEGHWFEKITFYWIWRSFCHTISATSLGRISIKQKQANKEVSE